MSIILKFLLLLIFLAINAPTLASGGSHAASGTHPANHGDAELSWLLEDLPQLQDVVFRGNPVWEWLENAFNYSDGGVKIYWDPNTTTKEVPFGGETQFIGTTCFIRIDSSFKKGPFVGVDKRAEEVLACLVFELNNARHQRDFSKLLELLDERKLSRNEFILSSARIEFKSGQGTKKFLTDVWLPYCQSRLKEPDFKIWAPFQSKTFDEMMTHYPPGSPYPWKIYGDQYDQFQHNRSH